MLGFKVLSGREALTWCRNHRDRWDGLHSISAAPNPFVSRRFVSTWFTHYADSWTPVIVTAESAAGELHGLLPLGLRGSERRLVAAGDYHAEYQGWLCTPGMHDRFLSGALSALFETFPGHVLELRYVADRDCRDAIDRCGRGRLETTVHHKPVLDIDRQRLAASERKSGNRSKLNRLRRHGEIEFRRLGSADELEAVFDEIIDACDFRQGAANGTCPFASDPRKKTFHLAWMRAAPEQFHITCMRQRGRIVAAAIGVVIGDQISLAIQSHLPQHAEQSPGKFLIQWTAQHVADPHLRSIDLTPGGDPWKERLATRSEPVWAVRIHEHVWRRQLAQVPDRLRWLTKKAAGGRNADPARDLLRRARRITPRRVGDRLGRLLPRREEYRVYRFTLARESMRGPRIGDASVRDPRIRVDSLRDLVDLAESLHRSGVQDRQRFLCEAADRLTRGHHVYTLADRSRAVHYRWIAPRQTESFFTEVNCRYRYPAPGPVSYDSYTLPSARSKGFSQLVLEHVLHDLARTSDAGVAYISALADNTPSIRIIEKNGAVHIASITRRTLLWRERIDRTPGSTDERRRGAPAAASRSSPESGSGSGSGSGSESVSATPDDGRPARARLRRAKRLEHP